MNSSATPSSAKLRFSSAGPSRPRTRVRNSPTDRLDVRDHLAVEDGVNGETGGLVRELELARAEVQPPLHVRARNRQHRPARELTRDRPMHVAGDDPPHLPVARDDLAERMAARVREPD